MLAGAIVHLRFLVIAVEDEVEDPVTIEVEVDDSVPVPVEVVHPSPSKFLRYEVPHGPFMVVTTFPSIRVP